jgi:hypothetical protein
MRTKTLFKFMLVAGLFAYTATALHAQVGINNTGTTPDASAILDLQTGNTGVNKGFLPQSVALAASNVAAPVTGAATGLIVYNTATAGTSPNNVLPGYYYWNGSAWLGMGAPTMGTGITSYVAVWTPNNNTLGTGSIRDNGTEIGVNAAPAGGEELLAEDAHGDYSILGFAGDEQGIYAFGSKEGGYFTDSLGDRAWIGDAGWPGGANIISAQSNQAILADDENGFGVNGYGQNSGGYFSDPSGDYSYLADNGSENGIYAYGFNDGGAFVSYSYDAGTSSYDLEDYAYIAMNTDEAGGYFEDGLGDYTYIATGGSALTSNVPKSTEIKDETGQERMLFCNESPEVMFEDYGEGQLINGKAHISLDPLLAKNVAIGEKHPLRVYIELLGDCNGTYVSNRSATGFDVVELKNGTSNTAFQWHIICNRANEAGQYHNFADKRFPVGPGPMPKPAIANKPKSGSDVKQNRVAKSVAKPASAQSQGKN